MTPDDVVRSFLETLSSDGRVAAAERWLDTDVILDNEGMPRAVGRDGWLASQALFEGSFPDLHEEVSIVRVEGNVVEAVNTTSGTHTGELDLTAAGFVSSPRRTDTRPPIPM